MVSTKQKGFNYGQRFPRKTKAFPKRKWLPLPEMGSTKRNNFH